MGHTSAVLDGPGTSCRVPGRRLSSADSTAQDDSGRLRKLNRDSGSGDGDKPAERRESRRTRAQGPYAAKAHGTRLTPRWSEEEVRDTFTFKNLVAVGFFLFGTTFLWMTRAFLG